VAFTSLGLVVWFGSGAFGDNGGFVQRAFMASAFGLPVAVALRAGDRMWPIRRGGGHEDGRAAQP
jgi:hypothetical protein